jgi:uncharacterized SAM-binding protein YcdF (DUF218 family)
MPYDAVLIAGGGVREGGVLPDHVAARFERALEVAGDAVFVPLSAGTPHRPPPRDGRGLAIFEARAGADYLVRRGVDPRRIAIEESSYDTIGNAYFSRVIHVIPRGFRRILVITSAFHMPRTEAIFRWVYGLDAPGPACSLEFDPVPDDGIDPDALAVRAVKERLSLEIFRALAARMATLAELHAWMFAEHGAYAAGPRTPSAAIDSRLY